LRTISLSKSGINKVRSHQFELKVSDFEDSLKSLHPGEWCLFKSSHQEMWVGFVNPLIDDKFACTCLLSPILINEIGKFSTEEFIALKIKKAFERRLQFSGYENNSRLFYGMSDGLPGLIIDQFENASIIQINSAGIDRFRNLIKSEVEAITKKSCYFLDNQKYREKESLPTYENEIIPELHIVENKLKYKIRSEVLQKIGFYFDHRENRYQLINILSRLSKKFLTGVDLFSYVGAWGISALKAGVNELHFVDQGDFSIEVSESLRLNQFENRGTYHRIDVFKFLDDAITKGTLFDLVLCDPPAFAKSALQKSQALEGYSKLHRKVLRSISSGGVAVFSSCTHYVSHEEFQKNILDAAFKENKKIQLIYTGIQGLDHPISSQDDRSNYIKSYFYIVE